MNPKHIIKMTAVLLIAAFLSASAQTDSITVIPGKEYAGGEFHNLIFGKHWRDLWTTPIRVKVLDLKRFAGGLTLLSRGGGQQTKSLRFKGKDGKIWKFRSIDKDPSKILPEELRGSISKDVVQDQISSSNPVAPLIVAEFLIAVGTLQSVPQLVYLPDAPLMKEFRDEFGGTLGTIEIHPDAEEAIEFKDAVKVKETFKLLHRLEKKPFERVDAEDFLKARLIDIFVGDWDRHTHQWRWALFEDNGYKLWEPIPRERDQAFAKFDGLLPALAENLAPQFVDFDYDYPQIEDLTWSGRFLDRRFLVELSAEKWDSVTKFVTERLTDSVIVKAVGRIPREMRAKAADKLIAILKSRRDKLPDISNAFYRRINKYADIYCTNLNDSVYVLRSKEKTIVERRIRNSPSNPKNSGVLFKKIFHSNITEDIRIHLLDGEDIAVIEGECGDPIVRVIGGKGKDEFIDNTEPCKSLGNIFIPYSEKMNLFYDSGKKTVFKLGANSGIDRTEYPEPKTDEAKYEPKKRNRGHDWKIYPIADINNNDGLLLGGGPMLTSYNFRMFPFEYMMKLTAAYATRPKAFNFQFNGLFYGIWKHTALDVSIRKTDLAITDYYGYGNESPFDLKLDDADYYELEQQLFSFETVIRFNYMDEILGSFGFRYEISDIEIPHINLIRDFPIKNYGLGIYKNISFSASFSYDDRDNAFFAFEGFYANLRTRFYPKTLSNLYPFAEAAGNIELHLKDKFTGGSIYSLYLGAAQVTGKHPFQKSVFLGGANSLLAYNRMRFSGDSYIYGQIQWRKEILDLNILIPGKLGLQLLAESGRVFIQNDNSKKWHPGVAAGLWACYLNRSLAFSFYTAYSNEGFYYYLNTVTNF